MEIIAGTIDTFSADVLFDMARYRHEVFVEKLGWKLHTRGRLELDEFDRKDTIYLIARNPVGEIVGTSRLLPTHRPYLLASLFPQLLGDTPAPCSPDIWELSRFAAGDGTRLGIGGDPHGWSLALDMLSAAMRTVAKEGGRRLISASPWASSASCAARACPRTERHRRCGSTASFCSPASSTWTRTGARTGTATPMGPAESPAGLRAKGPLPPV